MTYNHANSSVISSLVVAILSQCVYLNRGAKEKWKYMIFRLVVKKKKFRGGRREKGEGTSVT